MHARARSLSPDGPLAYALRAAAHVRRWPLPEALQRPGGSPRAHPPILCSYRADCAKPVRLRSRDVTVRQVEVGPQHLDELDPISRTLGESGSAEGRPCGFDRYTLA